MSPKGGIKPHNKFGVASNRAEVLFVDYIVNHLKPKGRAGIVVPEGVIFQSGKAYKELRKNLVENGLFAVVSLPSGVFQPYSGVKTSILFLDNELAKLKSQIAFVKISADGFDLGSSKRAISKNDLPEALEVLQAWASGNTVESQTATLVEKSDLVANGDYNLSGDRYQTNSDVRNSNWPIIPLGDLVDVLNGFAFKSELYTDKGTRIIRITNVQKGFVKDDEPKYYPESLNSEISKYFLKENDLLVSLTGNVGRVALLPSSFLPAALNQRVACLRINSEHQILEKYLYHILNLDKFEDECINASSGVAQKNLSTEWLKTFEIPLPPLEVQEQIVAELDGYTAIISGAKQIIDNWRPRIDVDPTWEVFPLGDLVDVLDSKRKPITKSDRIVGPYPYYGATGILDYVEGFLFDERLVLLGEDGAKWESGQNSAFIAEGKYWVNNHAHVFRPHREKLNDIYVVTLLNQMNLIPFITGVTVPKLNQERMRAIEIPLAPLQVQVELANEIEKERMQVDGAISLIEKYERKIQGVLAKLWLVN
jgi:type I restriction enzyme M protein